MNEDIAIKINSLRKVQDEIEAVKKRIEVNDANTIKEIWNDRNAELFIDSLNDVTESLDRLYAKVNISIDSLSFHAKSEGIANEWIC